MYLRGLLNTNKSVTRKVNTLEDSPQETSLVPDLHIAVN